MVKGFQRFKLSIIAGFMTLVMLIPTVFNSYGQYQDPPDGNWEDVVTRVVPPGDGGPGCYTILVLYCSDRSIVVHCQFNGVYGAPYSCEWMRCPGGGGTRYCVRK